jgi:putative peptidoglycan lipid II flippase
MNAAFVYPLRHAGLALAIGLGACLNAALLFRRLRRDGVYAPQPGWRVFIAKVLAALATMGIALWFAMGPEAWWIDAPGQKRVLALVGLVGLGMATYFGALWVLGFRLRDFSRRAA